MLARTREYEELARFLASREGDRPRAVLILGDPGSGKSHLLHALREAALSQPGPVLMLDDVDLAERRDQLEALLHDVSGEPGTRLLLAARSPDPTLLEELARRTDRRLAHLTPLDDEAARRLVATMGLPEWGFRTSEIVRRASGNARELCDLAFARADIDWEDDATLVEVSTRPRLSLWMQGLLTCRGSLRHEALTPDPANAEGWLVHAEERIQNGDFSAGADLAERAIHAARADGDRWLALRAEIATSYARTLLGDAIGTQSLHALAIAAEREGMRDLETLTWQRIFNAHFARGEVELSRAACRNGMATADRHRVLITGLLLRLQYVDQLLTDGERTAATELLREVLEVGRQRGLEVAQVAAAQLLSRILLESGDIGGARMLAEEAHARLPEDAYSLDRVVVRMTVARARSVSCDLDAAMHALGAPGDIRDDVQQGGQEVFLALEAIRVLTRAGASPETLDPWLRLIDTAPRFVIGGDIETLRLEARAWRAARAGDSATARQQLGEARKRWAEEGCVEDVEAIDMLIPIALSEQPGEPEAFAQLTKREREVARLVAHGRTNPEIAGELYLSVRTVEHHVAAVLRKLELSSRRELTAQRPGGSFAGSV